LIFNFSYPKRKIICMLIFETEVHSYTGSVNITKSQLFNKIYQMVDNTPTIKLK